MTTSEEIYLDPDGYIAQGNGSLVFNDPTNSNVLLKIPRKRKRAKKRGRLSTMLRPSKRRYGKFREWYREYEEYIAAIRKAGELPKCLPQPRGFVQTNLGPAFAVEKVSDENSTEMALTIKDYLKDHDPETLRPVLEKFFDDIRKYRIIMFDLEQHNQCVVRDALGKPIRIVCIDSIGESTLIQIRKLSLRAYNQWFNKKRAKFMREIFPVTQ